MVPTKLRSQLVTEAHACCFGGHFSEKKVYCRNYWWYGRRRDMWKFCRSCLSCDTRQGPGHSYRPPMMPIPVKGPFHRVVVDVLQLPLTSSVTNMLSYSWFILRSGLKRSQPLIKRLLPLLLCLIAHIICRNGVPEELLSDRGPSSLT